MNVKSEFQIRYNTSLLKLRLNSLTGLSELVNSDLTGQYRFLPEVIDYYSADLSIGWLPFNAIR
jgi:hypothetical protein